MTVVSFCPGLSYILKFLSADVALQNDYVYEETSGYSLIEPLK